MSKIQEILNALAANNNIIVDDHGRGDGTKVAEVIAMHGDDVVLLLNQATYYSINPLYIENGQVHLATSSVGGVMNQSRKSLAGAITEYNAFEGVYKRPNLTEVTLVPMIDETVTIVAMQVTPEYYARMVEMDPSMAEVKRTSSLNIVFLEACSRADYMIPKQMVGNVKLNDGAGYYGPLRHMVIVDDNREELKPNSSVMVVDPDTGERLYVIVLAVGDNLVIHPHHQNREGEFSLIATGHSLMKFTLGMNPMWADNYHGLVNAARIFNLEYDPFRNEVISTIDRPANFFKAINYNHDQ